MRYLSKVLGSQNFHVEVVGLTNGVNQYLEVKLPVELVGINFSIYNEFRNLHKVFNALLVLQLALNDSLLLHLSLCQLGVILVKTYWQCILIGHVFAEELKVFFAHLEELLGKFIHFLDEH